MSEQEGQTGEASGQDGPTLRERMLAAGMSEQRIAAYAEANAVLLDGVLTADLDQPVSPASRWQLAAAR